MSESAKPSFAMPLPWQHSAWEQLNHAWRTQRLPHALLLHGIAGLGKLALAHWLAQAVLCEEPAGNMDKPLKPCLRCASCLLFKAGSHPDFVFIAPEEDKQQISVEQIRAAGERLAMTSARHGFRVAIIEPAHQMTLAAANSLLKTLEEPGRGSLLILVSSQRAALLPTIRSRCQQLEMVRPNTEQAQTWLQMQTGKPVAVDLLELAGGAPLRALHYLQGGIEPLHRDMSTALNAFHSGSIDVTELAHEWADEHLPERLHWLDYWLMRTLRREILRNDDSITSDLGPASRQSGGQVLNISALYQTLDKLRELKAQLRRTALQKELALETIFLMMQRALNVRAS